MATVLCATEGPFAPAKTFLLSQSAHELLIAKSARLSAPSTTASSSHGLGQCAVPQAAAPIDPVPLENVLPPQD